MDATKIAVYRAELSGGYDFEEFEGEPEDDDIVIETAAGVRRRRVYREADPDTGAFASARFVIRDPAQIPLDSLMRYVNRAILTNSAPAEAVLSLSAENDRSTADQRDTDNVGRKMAAMLECDYVKGDA